MDFKKSINSFNYLLDNYFYYQFVNNFSELVLCKIKVLDIFNMID